MNQFGMVLGKPERINLSLLLITLSILSLALWKMEKLVQYNYIWKPFRYLFLAWTLIWLGFYAGGQVTIISILTWVTAPLHNPSWDVLLSPNTSFFNDICYY